MNIKKYLDWENPTIFYEDDAFEIEISKNEIEITCDWDHGWGGRGTERIYIPLETFDNLIKEIQKVKITDFKR